MNKSVFTALLAPLAISASGAAERADVLATYADIAHAKYSDSLIAARRLQDAVGRLVGSPSAEALHQARAAWLAARVPYQQTEVYRFGNAIVDDWEGKVNAWPLDEGLIDYVASDLVAGENELAQLNVIANPSLGIGGGSIDATDITPALLEDHLHEAGGNEANVATGYHAIEFLLWGQDLNGHEHGAGMRAWTDFLSGSGCTGGNCLRRAAYLTAATDLLVHDLEWMTRQWESGGAARRVLQDDADAGLAAVLTGMGSLSYGELAGERMRLGLLLNDPEEEHDCFSDNTHNSHYYDGLGIRNIYFGSYTRIDGTVVAGPALADLVAAADAELDAQMRSRLVATMQALAMLKAVAEAGTSYDQMLARDSRSGEKLIMAAVDGLISQTRTIERVVAALDLEGIEFEGSDSLDNPRAVFE